MNDPLPEWLRQTPNLESLHNLPDVPWGGYSKQGGVPLPSLPDLAEFVQWFLEKFLERVVMAVVGFIVPGVGSFEQLQEWAENLGAQITSFIYNSAGINLASWDAFVASLADGKGIDLPVLKAGLDFLSAIFGGLDFDDLPTPAEAWQLVADTFLSGIFSIPADVQASINAALGDLQSALNGSYSGSGPIFLAVQALAEAWLTATSPLDAANLVGSIAASLISGVLGTGNIPSLDASKITSGAFAQSMVTGLTGSLDDLQTTLNQIGDIFDGAVVTPVNSVVNAVKSWFNSWFGGGSTNAIPASQKGAASGVAPLNSSTKLETSYLQTNVANGVAGLNASGKVVTSLLVTDSANNPPTLDSGGLLKRSQQPVLAPKVASVSPSGAGAVSVNVSTTEQVNISVASGVGLGSWAITGTPLDGQSLLIRIKDDGSPALLAWATAGGGASKFRAVGVSMPTGTVGGKYLYVGCKWNAADSVFDVLAVGQEA